VQRLAGHRDLRTTQRYVDALKTLEPAFRLAKTMRFPYPW
jgi:site-specific recombinase XerD